MCATLVQRLPNVTSSSANNWIKLDTLCVIYWANVYSTWLNMVKRLASLNVVWIVCQSLKLNWHNVCRASLTHLSICLVRQYCFQILWMIPFADDFNNFVIFRQFKGWTLYGLFARTFIFKIWIHNKAIPWISLKCQIVLKLFFGKIPRLDCWTRKIDTVLTYQI